MTFIIALAAGAATFLGGLLALRFRDKLHLILGFSAGAVIAVAFFDLIPEAFELAEGFREPEGVALLIALGFFAYLVIDRALFFRSVSTDRNEHEEAHGHSHGALGAGGIVAHSFFDGVAVGLAFQVSAAIGALVATAVLIHKISDGVSTVGVVSRRGGDRSRALWWLAAAAVAPALGIALASVVTLSQGALGAVLAVFAGFFVYLGASDLIPESHHEHPKLLTTVMTILGAAALYVAILFAHGH